MDSVMHLAKFVIHVARKIIYESVVEVFLTILNDGVHLHRVELGSKKVTIDKMLKIIDILILPDLKQI